MRFDRQLIATLRPPYSQQAWCADGVRIVYGWCTDGVRMVYGWCTDGVRMVYGWCTEPPKSVLIAKRWAPQSHLWAKAEGRMKNEECRVSPAQSPYISFNRVSAISDGVGGTAIPASLTAAILA